MHSHYFLHTASITSIECGKFRSSWYCLATDSHSCSVFGIWRHINLVQWNENLNNVPYLLIQYVVQNISCHSKMLIILLIILYFSRYVMKERHQKVEIWTSQKPKQETRLKTRVNPCLRSHQERKRIWKISVLRKHLNY